MDVLCEQQLYFNAPPTRNPELQRATRFRTKLRVPPARFSRQFRYTEKRIVCDIELNDSPFAKAIGFGTWFREDELYVMGALDAVEVREINLRAYLQEV